jgi:hypothetical protein
MSDKTIQQQLFPDDPDFNTQTERQPKKLSLDAVQRAIVNQSNPEFRVIEGIPQLTLPTRWELLQPRIQSDDVSLRTIIRPVPQAIQIVRNITEYLRTTSGCQVLVVRADTGSGKTTFLNTLPHYMPDVNFNIQTLDLQFVSEDDFGSELNKLKLNIKGVNLIILEGREKPESISDRYIQVVLSNTTTRAA